MSASQLILESKPRTMFTRLLVVVLVSLPLLVSSRPTHCERHKGDSEFRCGKDDYGADHIHIRNIAGTEISFKVGMWFSTCGRPGVNYSDQTYTMKNGESVDVEFAAAKAGVCNELYVYGCRRGSSGINCLDIVSVYPV